jgi:hypothetical protein
LCIKLLERSFKQPCSDAIYSSTINQGLLFAGVLLPFRKRIFELGQLWGGFSIAAIVFIFGYLAASGGLIEHYVYFTAESYPLKFALITLIEILIQTLLLGQLVMLWERKFNGDYYK